MSRADERLAEALVAEHAAIFGYGPVGAHLDAATVPLAHQAEAAHRSRRDAVAMRLLARGASAPVAEPAYALPALVNDQTSALRLAILIEERTAAVWRAALLDTASVDRRIAVDALVDCAIRATRLRRAAGITPATVAFPGRLPSN
jgi:hypothetical protein